MMTVCGEYFVLFLFCVCVVFFVYFLCIVRADSTAAPLTTKKISPTLHNFTLSFTFSVSAKQISVEMGALVPDLQPLWESAPRFLCSLSLCAHSWQSACSFRKPCSLATVATDADPPGAETQPGHGPSVPGEAGPCSPRPPSTDPSPAAGSVAARRSKVCRQFFFAATQSPLRALTTMFYHRK